VRVLVTGGAGFIGSHLVDGLVARGDAVTAVDHLTGDHAGNLDAAVAAGATLVQADVTDVAVMMRILQRARPEVVYHLAAQIDVRQSVLDPSTDAHVNVGGTAAVLEAVRSAGTGRVVLASTAGVYGDPPELPAGEESPIAPLSPYGASKAAAETYMRLYARLHGISTLSLRMANVYGPRQDPHADTGVIAIFCAAASTAGVATLFGGGAQTRDYVFVDDVVAAFLAAGSSDIQGALNVATGQPTSVRDLARALELRTIDAPARAGEVHHSYLDPTRAARALGWSAAIALDEGLSRTRRAYGRRPTSPATTGTTGR
jgi:UDP-glucose 4-epimerase